MHQPGLVRGMEAPTKKSDCEVSISKFIKTEMAFRLLFCDFLHVCYIYLHILVISNKYTASSLNIDVKVSVLTLVQTRL